MLMGNAGAGPVAPNFASTTQKNQYGTSKPAKANSTNPSEATTTDNSQPIAQYEPDHDPLQTFESTLAEKKVSENLQNQPDTKKAIKQSNDKDGSNVDIPTASITVAHLNKAEGENQILQLDSAVIAEKKPAILQNVNETPLKQLTVVAKNAVIADKAPTAESPKVLEADTEKTANNQQTGIEVTSQVASSDTNTSVKDESVVEAPSPSQKTDVPTADIQTLSPKSAADIQTLSPKPAADASVQEIPTHQALNGEQKVFPELTSDSTTEKSPVSNEVLPQDTSIAVPKGQTNGLIDPKTTDSNTDSGQNLQNSNTGNGQNVQNSKPELFEISVKPQSQPENIPDGPSAKDMTSMQVQVNAVQTPKGSDLLGDQAQNSDIEIFEQLITDNNIQPSSTQQSPMLAATSPQYKF